MSPQRISLLSVPIDPLTKKEVLEKIQKYISTAPQFIHIMSVNPENVVIAHQNPSFLRLYQECDLALADGIGVILGAALLGFSLPARVQGSVLLPSLLNLAGHMSLRTVLIGSQANLADKIAKCYSQSYPTATFIGIQGYVNKHVPTQEEEKQIEDIVRATRPHFVFVAFGSPFQELWISSHKKLLQASICMGVGGGFDYLSGASERPNKLIQTLGFEWLYRLIKEPHRASRQLRRLPIFIGLVLKEWILCIMHPHHGT